MKTKTQPDAPRALALDRKTVQAAALVEAFMTLLVKSQGATDHEVEAVVGFLVEHDGEESAALFREIVERSKKI